MTAFAHAERIGDVDGQDKIFTITFRVEPGSYQREREDDDDDDEEEEDEEEDEEEEGRMGGAREEVKTVCKNAQTSFSRSVVGGTTRDAERAVSVSRPSSSSFLSACPSVNGS